MLNTIPQLQDVIADHFQEILEVHHQIHYDSDTITTSSRKDIRLFPGFAESIESVSEFQNNRLRLMLSISTDGFKAKRITRKDMWPLYLRVDDLGWKEANKYENSILCGAIYGRTKPNDILIENLLSR